MLTKTRKTVNIKRKYRNRNKPFNEYYIKIKKKVSHKNR